MIRNRLIYSFMILMSILGLGISGNRGSYIMLLSMLILAVLSVVLAFMAGRGLQVTQGLSDEMIMKSDFAAYGATIQSRYFGVATLYINFKKLPDSVSFDPESNTYELFGKAQVNLSAGVSSKYRGVYEIGIESVEIRDFLQIFRFVKTVNDAPFITICPDIVDFSDDLFLVSPSEQIGVSRNKSSEDYSSISDIRPFEHSDSMKKIHWKLSAKKNELMVKNYDITNNTATAIIVDNRFTPDMVPDKAALEDMLIEMAVSIVKYHLSSNQSVMLDFMESAPVKFHENTISGFDRMYFACSSIVMGANSIEDVLAEYQNPNFALSAIYVLTIDPDRNVDAFVKTAALSGHNINLIHFFEKEGGNRLSKYDSTGVNYYGACLENRHPSLVAGE